MVCQQDNRKDFYKVLGLSKTADVEGVKAAYKALALKWHPDRHHSRKKEEAARRFIEINEAYISLMQKYRRASPVADSKTKSSPSPSPTPTPPTTSLSPDFRSRPGAEFLPRPASPSENSASAKAIPKKVRFDFIKGGPPSEGHSSASPGDFIKKGPPSDGHSSSSSSHSTSSASSSQAAEGEVDEDDFEFSASVPDEDEEGTPLYPSTLSTTAIPSEWIFPLQLTLDELKYGTSIRFRITRHLLTKKKKAFYVNVTVQPGWRAGTRVRFPGIGNERVGLPPQDIVFVVEVAKHEKYVREGDDLVTKVEMSLEDALTGSGGFKLIRGVGEKAGWIEVPVPASVVSPGAETRIPGAGMPIRKGGKIVGQGDLIVKWDIQFPTWLSKGQKEDWKELFSSLSLVLAEGRGGTAWVPARQQKAGPLEHSNR